MKIIISEKAIAGQRIADILSEGDAKLELIQGISLFHFSKDNEDYLIIPLKGHIIDVDFPLQYKHWLGVDVRKLAESEIEYKPIYPLLVSVIEKKSKTAKELIIATDADREGEAIGLEAINIIKKVNPKIKIKRAYFSAITPQDINEAFGKLTDVDYDLAESANARREIDLIWGASLTRFISLVSGRLGKDFLSVGRVQNPTLKLIIDRAKERKAFNIEKFWEVVAKLEKSSETFFAMHSNGRFKKKEDAEKAVSASGKKGIVTNVTKTEKTIKKPVPFNTTEFLRAASAIGFSASNAMNVAESLYMQGLISYPRTDNQTYPKTINLAKILIELGKIPEFQKITEFLLSKKPLSPSRGKLAKDHPPIHPVSHIDPEKLSSEKWRIYELVCRRFFATLADDALTEQISVEINLNKEKYIANGQRILDKGWKAFYYYSQLKEIILPELKRGDDVKCLSIDINAGETKPPPLYSQGSLIVLMEKNNLGTKATRPEIIKKLQQRQYVIGNKQLEPTNVGFSVTEIFERHAQDLVKPNMTASLEKEMDEIADGKRAKKDVVGDSRKLLLLLIEKLVKEKNEVGKELREGLQKDSVVGNCQKCSGKLVVRHGRSGKRFLGCTGYPNCRETFPLPQKGRLVITSKLCKDCGLPVVQIIGRRRYEMCIKLGCVSKADWGKNKKQAKEEIKEAGAILIEKNKTVSAPKAASAEEREKEAKVKKPRKTTEKKIKDKEKVAKPAVKKRAEESEDLQGGFYAG